MSQEERPEMKYRVKVTRHLYTFNNLLSASYHALDLVQGEEKVEFYKCMFSMLSAAFAVEAYLNHLGQAVFDEGEWSNIQKDINIKAKLRVLAKIIDFKIDFGKRPFQTFDEMVKYRNIIVHAGTETLYGDEQEYGPREYPVDPETWWEQETTLMKAERFRADARELMRQLHQAAGLPEDELRTTERIKGIVFPPSE